ncbi:MAG: SEC-C metal-binding domain-containing protein, partial [Verrucomicrobiota bacterium]
PGIERDVAKPEPRRREGRTLITDAINEMEWWVSFHPEDSQAPEPPGVEPPAPPPSPPPPPPVEYVPPQPFVRQPKIGRNDPCPCGSGKKYKNCCGKG